MKIVQHKQNLNISFSARSGQYSQGISYQYLPGWGNLSGKIVSIKPNHQSYSFFFIAISLLVYVATFSGQLYFWRSNFFTLFQSDYFDTTVTFWGQLFFQNSFFFRAKILQNSHFLRIRSSLWQLLSATAIFSLFKIKISKKELLFQSRYFCTVSTFSKKVYYGKS